MIHEIKNFLNSRSYSFENIGIKKILIIEPTNISDVYYLYDNNADDRIGSLSIAS